MLFKSFVQTILEGIHVFTPEGEYINKPLDDFLDDLYYGKKIILKPDDIVQVSPEERKYWFISFIGKEFEEHGETKTVDILQMNFTNNYGFNTPIGLYSYPLEYAKEYIDKKHYSKNDPKFPFATNGKTCVAFKISNEAFKNVWTTKSFTKTVYTEKVKKLIDIVCDNYKEKVTNHLIKIKLINNKEQVKEDKDFKNVFEKYIESMSGNIINNMKRTDLASEKVKEITDYYERKEKQEELINGCYLGQFFYLIYNLFSYDYKNILDKKTPKIKSKEYRHYPRLYTKIFKELNCNGIVDDGYGFIYFTEPIQAVFFSATQKGLIERQLYASNDLGKKKLSQKDIEKNIEKSKQFKKTRKLLQSLGLNISKFEIYGEELTEDNIHKYIDTKNKIVYNISFINCVINKCDYKFVSCDFNSVIGDGVTFENCTFEDFKEDDYVYKFANCTLINCSGYGKQIKCIHCNIDHLQGKLFYNKSYFENCDIKLKINHKLFETSENVFKDCDLYLALSDENTLISDYFTNISNTKISSKKNLKIVYKINLAGKPSIEDYTKEEYKECIKRMDIQCDTISKLILSFNCPEFGVYSNVEVILPYTNLNSESIDKIANPDNFTNIMKILTEFLNNPDNQNKNGRKYTLKTITEKLNTKIIEIFK